MEAQDQLWRPLWWERPKVEDDAAVASSKTYFWWVFWVFITIAYKINTSTKPHKYKTVKATKTNVPHYFSYYLIFPILSVITDYYLFFTCQRWICLFFLPKVWNYVFLFFYFLPPTSQMERWFRWKFGWKFYFLICFTDERKFKNLSLNC